MLKIASHLLAALAFLGAIALVGSAHGGETRQYEREQFQSAVAAGGTVLVAVHASWCPTCAAQRPRIAKIMTEPEFRDAVLYVVDFDWDMDFLRAHRVSAQSTLIAFRGGKEVARSLAQTSEESIRALFSRGL